MTRCELLPGCVLQNKCPREDEMTGLCFRDRSFRDQVEQEEKDTAKTLIFSGDSDSDQGRHWDFSPYQL